jgi:hypothetical protein
MVASSQQNTDGVGAVHIAQVTPLLVLKTLFSKIANHMVRLHRSAAAALHRLLCMR